MCAKKMNFPEKYFMTTSKSWQWEGLTNPKYCRKISKMWLFCFKVCSSGR